MTTDKPYSPPPIGQPYSPLGFGETSTEIRTRRTLRLHTILLTVVLAFTVAIAGFCLVVMLKYFQVKHAVEELGNQVGSSFDLPSPSPTPDAPAVCYVDPTDSSCPPGFDPYAGD